MRKSKKTNITDRFVITELEKIRQQTKERNTFIRSYQTKKRFPILFNKAKKSLQILFEPASEFYKFFRSLENTAPEKPCQLFLCNVCISNTLFITSNTLIIGTYDENTAIPTNEIDPKQISNETIEILLELQTPLSTIKFFIKNFFSKQT